MYFPRLPPKLLKLGQVPCRGNESGGNFDIRFCHFFDVVGSNPVWCMKRKSAFFSFFLFFFARKSQITKPHYTKFVSGYVRAQVSLFSLFTLVIARLYPPPKGVFRSFFSPTCHENDFPTQVFTLWRCKQKLLDAFSCRLASHDKKIWLISLLFAIFDTKNAMRSEKVIFHEKQPKVNFLILDPLCEKREKWFFFTIFPFSVIQGGPKA